MAQIVVVGEGMLEICRAPGAEVSGDWRLGYGGDTLNTAIHLARFGERVRYLTALGDDPFSDELRERWGAEGIDPALILTAPGAMPGLYAISTDAEGDRSFSYWRGESAARQVFALPGSAAALGAAGEADMLIFSLISLAILPEAGREALLGLAASLRAQGKMVAFDGNYRPRLWADAAEARAWRDRAVACCTIGLPTLEDEQAMGESGSAADTARRWQALGGGEVIVKLGADGCLLPDGQILPPPERLRPRDTSGAGDAFNAGYLHARAAGHPPVEAAAAGHRLAGWVVMRPGAVPARAAPDPYTG
ncbi:ketodeoxygluconokinase [Sphingomonas metalli]|uniref:Ketodeoxygluconokinase n=1 Tax=Sphingomonas metalli TaxID=1779358 RepID=A0A916SY59_9SPHN|nr:sugar kinase [Sphingomonas metalli]GGB22948.1 ketodeoxygluconokinase [Sphingomonas metalli]